MRAATKHISKTALQHNLKVLSELAPNSHCMAVIKANAYGSESTQILDALGHADLFGVATIEEALAIRHAGATKPIVLLEGAFEADDMALAVDHHFELIIATEQQLNWLIDNKHDFSRVWFKLDTGMGRLGFQSHNCHTAMRKVLARYPQKSVVIMTHFSDSDSPERSITNQQIARFDDFASHYPDCQQSLCNSAGILSYPHAHRDYVRPGIALYGASPFAGNFGEDHGLQPVMTLTSRVLSVKSSKQGEPIGYAQTYRMENDGRIAICEIGYADGYSRFIPSGSPILINDIEYQLVGRVAMDMIAVLVDDNVEIGNKVICWGKGLPIERLCEAADTIPHQLLTTVTERPKKVIE